MKRSAPRSRQRGFLLNPARFGGGGGGTDPAIRSEQTFSLSSATTHTPTMPPSVGAGDRIVVCLGFNNAPTVTIDTGFSGSDWTVHQDAAGTNCKVWVASKTATGSDALRITLSAGNTCGGASFSIDNGDVLRSAAQSFAAPGSDTADPPAVAGLTNGGVAVCFVILSGNGSLTTSSSLSGYSLVSQVAANHQLFAVTKTLASTSEDPSSYAPGGNTAHVIATAVITLS